MPYNRNTMNCDKPSKRKIQSFEPCGPIMEMITLELNNRTRGKKNKRGEKVKFFEDAIAAAYGGKYPKLLQRFHILREEAA